MTTQGLIAIHMSYSDFWDDPRGCGTWSWYLAKGSHRGEQATLVRGIETLLAYKLNKSNKVQRTETENIISVLRTFLDENYNQSSLSQDCIQLMNSVVI